MVAQLLQEQTLKQQVMEARGTSPDETTSPKTENNNKEKGETNEDEKNGSFQDEAHVLALQNKIYHLSVSLDEANAKVKGSLYLIFIYLLL